MLNIEIKYTNLSNDYDRLFDLLAEGYAIVGFLEKNDHSKVIEIRFIGSKLIFDGTIVDIANYTNFCEMFKIRFFDL